MRVFACLLLSIWFSPVFAQAQIDESTRRDNEAYSLYDVKQLLKMPPGFSSGASEKVNNRLGDRIGVALIRIFDEKQLADPATVRSYLPLIRSAFQIPRLISIPSDRKPNVTIFLLTWLEQQVKDPSLKHDVAALAREIKEKTSENK
jgi:hypothetical protein